MINFDLTKLRGIAEGTIGEEDISKLQEGFDLDEDEFDEAFQECAALGIPLIIQGQIMEECCGNLEDVTNETYAMLTDYLVGQGYINEASASYRPAPKTSIIRMNADAIKKRLKTIYTLYFARKNNDKAYKKYKIGCGIKKQNRAIMDKKYGAKAERMAEKHYRLTKGGKFKAGIDHGVVKVKNKAKRK